MSNEEIVNYIIQTCKSQLMHLQQECLTANLNELDCAIQRVIELMD